ncbi:MAG TPA: DNA ligase D [Candidatus Eisenbacteria bacterium]|nr:DNA ligase D [Candidatus Eisenbacteria bacterium]
MSPTRNPNLEKYRQKRDPGRTPEPFGESSSGGAPGAGRRFVVQKHWARAMHYDLRLELDGVLKSWAVPKGPSTRAEEKRLAVHVEDHPLEYGSFEGMIPAGNYGAGSVIVWDDGWYRSFKSEDLMEQYERGKMELEFFGFKMRGRWTLVRMSRSQKDWLFLKKDDGLASSVEAVDRYPESVITGLTVEEMRDRAGTLASVRERAVSLGASKGDLFGAKLALTLATLEDRPPKGPDWLYEIKYDGVRVLASRREGDVQMIGRSGEDITKRYPEIAQALAALATPRFTLDGEIIAEDENGHPLFQRLQARMHLTKPRDIEAARTRIPVRAVFFDCLGVEGYDLRGLKLEERKELLARVVPPRGAVQRADHILEHGEAFLAAVAEMGLEGIVAKRIASRYAGRRTPDWVKVKCDRRDLFVIGGATRPQGARTGFGALHVGRYDKGKLVYVTKVGTGFDDKALKDIGAELKPLERGTSPFDTRSPKGPGHTWYEPRLVCEVRYTEWTREGGLRHPAFLGMRPGVNPEDVKAPEAMAIEADGEGTAPAAPTAPAERTERAAPAKRAKARPAVSGERHEVALTNLKKKFWPDGTTKGDLVGYYEKVAPLLLPYLRDRPVVLTRYPDGIEGKSFFQKDAPVYVPGWVRTQMIHAKDTDRDIRYFVIDDEDMLRYVANMGTIPLHVWNARVASLDRPDWMVLDLDPKEAPFTHVVQVARALKKILDDLELPSVPKTSGATGLHILLPMERRYTHEEVRTFARLLATMAVETLPDISTIVRAIRGRGGKVYVDFGQNGHGNTIVAPYSVRPLPGAPASCPLRWDEVNARLDPARFTIRTIPERFEEMEDPLRTVLGEGIDMAEAIATIERRMRD